jgi:hypothetical protein
MLHYLIQVYLSIDKVPLGGHGMIEQIHRNAEFYSRGQMANECGARVWADTVTVLALATIRWIHQAALG